MCAFVESYVTEVCLHSSLSLTCPVSYLPCCFGASNTPTVSRTFPSGLFLPNTDCDTLELYRNSISPSL